MRYHINPETGKAGQCGARKGNCRFRNKNDADQEIPHYPTKEAAQKAYEEIAGKKYGSTASVKKESRQPVKKVEKASEKSSAESRYEKEAARRTKAVKDLLSPGDEFTPHPNLVELTYRDEEDREYVQILSSIVGDRTAVDDEGYDMPIRSFEVRNGDSVVSRDLDQNTSGTVYYESEKGEVFTQPVTDMVDSGTLIDPDNGDDMEMIGFSYTSRNIPEDSDEDPLDAEMREQGFSRVPNSAPERDEEYLRAVQNSEPPYDPVYDKDSERNALQDDARILGIGDVVKPRPAAPAAPTMTHIAQCTDLDQLRTWWQQADQRHRDLIKARVGDLQKPAEVDEE